MKKLYLLFFALLTAYTLQAQDIITESDKTEVKALVTGISDETIEYQPYDFQEGSVYKLKGTDEHKIVYSNAREEKSNTLETVPAKTGSGISSLPGKLSEQHPPMIQTSTESLARTFVGVTYSRHVTFSEEIYDFDTFPVYGFNVLLEKYFEPKQGSTKGPSKGFGLASTNYFGYSENLENGTYHGSRHYITGYLFKEIAVKKIVTMGGLFGGGLCYTRGKADENNAVNPGESAGVFGGGAHAGLFLQRALTTGEAGKPTFLVRLGYDIFIMSNANMTLGTNLSISF